MKECLLFLELYILIVLVGLGFLGVRWGWFWTLDKNGPEGRSAGYFIRESIFREDKGGA